MGGGMKNYSVYRRVVPYTEEDILFGNTDPAKAGRSDELYLGEVEATDEEAALEKASKEYGEYKRDIRVEENE
jgi:hypothetical protein